MIFHLFSSIYARSDLGSNTAKTIRDKVSFIQIYHEVKWKTLIPSDQPFKFEWLPNLHSRSRPLSGLVSKIFTKWLRGKAIPKERLKASSRSSLLSNFRRRFCAACQLRLSSSTKHYPLFKTPWPFFLSKPYLSSLHYGSHLPKRAQTSSWDRIQSHDWAASLRAEGTSSVTSLAKMNVELFTG